MELLCSNGSFNGCSHGLLLRDNALDAIAAMNFPRRHRAVHLAPLDVLLACWSRWKTAKKVIFEKVHGWPQDPFGINVKPGESLLPVEGCRCHLLLLSREFMMLGFGAVFGSLSPPTDISRCWDLVVALRLADDLAIAFAVVGTSWPILLGISQTRIGSAVISRHCRMIYCRWHFECHLLLLIVLGIGGNGKALAGLRMLLVNRWFQLPIFGFGSFELAVGAALYVAEAGRAVHVFWNPAAVLLRGHVNGGLALLLMAPPLLLTGGGTRSLCRVSNDWSPVIQTCYSCIMVHVHIGNCISSPDPGGLFIVFTYADALVFSGLLRACGEASVAVVTLGPWKTRVPVLLGDVALYGCGWNLMNCDWMRLLMELVTATMIFFPALLALELVAVVYAALRRVTPALELVCCLPPFTMSTC
ncbi:hypothetical protein Nepgr_033635 [Nepenthes gracilis]|uniref:Uncharacterized protein n=1 Tax=Nepenthes gracilis TaxID=150966 RepID=A0AAD3TMB6_NEPGR|nr:hypothetical protein Nepgr_033635 [Nepenthes gracilis]